MYLDPIIARSLAIAATPIAPSPIPAVLLSTRTPTAAAEEVNVCSLNAFDPSSWANSGAKGWLEDWFKDHNYDEHDWLNKMDVETTDDGHQNSVLDCKGLYAGGSCGVPEQQCQVFTPEQYFYVRQVAAQFNQYMTWAHEMLQDYSIANSLALDELVSDLDVYSRNEVWLDNLLRTFGAMMSIGDKMVKGTSGETGDSIGAIGAIFGLVAANNTPDDPTEAEIKKKVQAYFEKYFWGVRDSLTKITDRMFGGDQLDSDTDVLDNLIAQLEALGLDDSGVQSKVSKVLSSGLFLQSVSQSDITTAIETGFQQMKKRLIGVLFTASNINVLAVRMNEPDQYCNSYGDRFINGYCYQLYWTDGGHQKPVDANVLNKLEFKYGIDPAALYKNVDACDNNFDNGANNELSLADDENGYTPCFFNMIVIRTWEKDCVRVNPNFPSWWREIQSDYPCRKGAS